jgi:hypothetical protein
MPSHTIPLVHLFIRAECFVADEEDRQPRMLGIEPSYPPELKFAQPTVRGRDFRRRRGWIDRQDNAGASGERRPNLHACQNRLCVRRFVRKYVGRGVGRLPSIRVAHGLGDLPKALERPTPLSRLSSVLRSTTFESGCHLPSTCRNVVVSW